MKIWNNLKWLFNNPPTNLTHRRFAGLTCDYCGADSRLWCEVGVYCICEKCRKKVFDHVLLEKAK